MSTAEVRHAILEEIDQMRPDQRERVLTFARQIRHHAIPDTPFPPGVDMQELRKFRGLISPEDAVEMKRIIEEDCEQIDLASW